MLPLLTSVPGADSQSYTTVTNVATITTQATFTEMNPTPVMTSTETTNTSQDIYSVSGPVNGAGAHYCMVLQPISFVALKGQEIKGTFQSSAPNSLTLYVLSDANYKIWGVHGCDPEDEGASVVLSASQVTSYILDWSVAADGTYWLVIETYSTGPSEVTLSFAKYYSQAVEVTSYSIQTSLLTVAAPKTISFTSEQEVIPVSTSGGSLQASNLTFAVVAIVVVLGVVAALYFAKSRSKRT